MARLSIQKTGFTAGEVSPLLLGRGDLRAYENGASKLRNVFIHPTGGVARRSGTRFIDMAKGKGRLVAFEFNTEQVYLLVFTDLFLDVYRDGTKVAGIATPWTEAQVAGINWVQSADTLLVVHPEIAPKKITRSTESNWSLLDWSYLDQAGRIEQPHHKFADDALTLTPSATTGVMTLTASSDVFQAGHQGCRLRVQNKEVEVTSYTSPTLVQALAKETLASTAATKDWEEQAFSNVRGWPVSVCFHQDRMIIGGSRDLPNRLWMSKSADLFNFDLGDGLDDQAIEFAILSDQVNAVRAVFSGRHLQVFTSGAEWTVTGDPLTPANIQLHRQTQVGSSVKRTVPPRDVDGATLFVPRNGQELREFLFTDVEQAYQATDLAMLAQHLVKDPVDQDFDKSKRLLHMVMADGTMATLTVYRAEQVTAWTLQETAGNFLSVAVVGEGVYLLVERAGSVLIEVFDGNFQQDAALFGSSAQAKTVWTGLDHLEGQTVKVLADGAVRGDKTIVQGAVTLDEPAFEVRIGLGFTHRVEPLPPNVGGGRGAGQGGKIRLVSLTLRLKDTAAFRLDTGRGFAEVTFKRFGGTVLDQAPPGFTGDKKIRALGWKSGGTEPLWRLEQDTPLPFTLLSVTTEVGVNG